MIMLIMALISPAAANQCPSNLAPKKATIAYAEDCLQGGGPVVYQDGKTLCFVEKACKKEEHLRVYSDKNVTCGAPCTCPDWTSTCAHYKGAETRNSTWKDEEVKRMLNQLTPLDICGYQRKTECDQRPKKRWVNWVQLYDESNHPVTNLNLVYRNPQEPICVGDGLSQSGTAIFCKNKKCAVNATMFCAHQANEVIYLKGETQQVAIRAWGGSFQDVFLYTTPSAACRNCTVECTTGGVIVKTSGNARLIEACSRNHCERTESPENIENVVFPHAITVAPYEVSVVVFKGHETIYEKRIKCPAGAYCDQIACVACWEMLTNLHCAPRTLIVALAIFVYFGAVLLAVAVNCCFLMTGTGQMICGLGRALAAMLRWCWRKRPGANGRMRRLTATNQRGRIKVLKWTALIAMSLIMEGVAACDKATTISASQENCVKKNGVLECSLEDTVQWPVVSTGETVCLQIGDSTSRPLATVEIQVLEIMLECQKETLFYTYPYSPAVASSKRCPGMGSCTANRCSTVKRTDHVAELGEAMQHPGYSTCAESCGCAGCSCFWCSAGCLFYRPHAIMNKDRRMEVFGCPSWKQIARVVIRKIQPTRTQEYQLRLGAGQMEELEELHVQLTTMETPPLPVLNTQFITDGTNTAFVEDVNSLRCLTCNATACDYRPSCCTCTTYDELANCQCVSGATAEDTLRTGALPRKKRLWFKVYQQRVMVEANDTMIGLQATVANWRLTPVAELSTCTMQNTSISGCHSCREGAILTYTCTSSEFHSLGHVSCDNEVSFNVECSTRPEERHTTIVYDRTLLDTQCRLRCGVESEPFKIKAELAMVALMGRTSFETATQSIPVIFQNVLDLAMTRYEYILILVIVLCLLIFIFYCKARKSKGE